MLVLVSMVLYCRADGSRVRVSGGDGVAAGRGRGGRGLSGPSRARCGAGRGRRGMGGRCGAA